MRSAIPNPKKFVGKLSKRFLKERHELDARRNDCKAYSYRSYRVSHHEIMYLGVAPASI